MRFVVILGANRIHVASSTDATGYYAGTGRKLNIVRAPLRVLPPVRGPSPRKIADKLGKNRIVSAGAVGGHPSPTPTCSSSFPSSVFWRWMRQTWTRTTTRVRIFRFRRFSNATFIYSFSKWKNNLNRFGCIREVVIHEKECKQRGGSKGDFDLHERQEMHGRHSQLTTDATPAYSRTHLLVNRPCTLSTKTETIPVHDVQRQSHVGATN